MCVYIIKYMSEANLCTTIFIPMRHKSPRLTLLLVSLPLLLVESSQLSER